MKHIREYFRISEDDNQAGKVFLDAGCGLAPYAKAYAKNFPSATAIGIDMSEFVYHVITAPTPNLHVVRGDLRKQPFREGMADIVWSYGVLHHTPNTEEAFNSLVGTLSPEGKCTSGYIASTIQNIRLNHEQS